MALCNAEYLYATARHRDTMSAEQVVATTRTVDTVFFSWLLKARLDCGRFGHASYSYKQEASFSGSFLYGRDDHQGFAPIFMCAS